MKKVLIFSTLLFGIQFGIPSTPALACTTVAANGSCSDTGNSSAGNVTNAGNNTATTGSITGGNVGNVTGGSVGNVTGGNGGTGGNATNGANTLTGGNNTNGANTLNAGNASNNNGSNNASLSSSVVNNNPVSSSYAPPLVASADTCMGSSSMGGQGMTFGFSLGSTWTDKNCERLKNSRELRASGHAPAADALLCMDSDVREAMRIAGSPCPQDSATHAQVSSATFASTNEVMSEKRERRD